MQVRSKGNELELSDDVMPLLTNPESSPNRDNSSDCMYKAQGPKYHFKR